MASRLLLAEQRAALDSINTLTQREFVALWRTLDLTDARVATDALLVEVPTLTTVYGEMAATLSADLYDEIRAEAGAPGRFRAAPAPAAPVEQVHALVRWGVSPLWSDTPDGALALRKVAGGLTRLTLQPARQTTVDSAKADPAFPRYARTTHAGACSFCLMLASRGAVYTDRAPYFEAHDYCKCSAVQVYDNEDPPEENQHLQQEWQEVTRGSSDPRKAWDDHINATRTTPESRATPLGPLAPA